MWIYIYICSGLDVFTIYNFLIYAAVVFDSFQYSPYSILMYSWRNQRFVIVSMTQVASSRCSPATTLMWMFSFDVSWENRLWNHSKMEPYLGYLCTPKAIQNEGILGPKNIWYMGHPTSKKRRCWGFYGKHKFPKIDVAGIVFFFKWLGCFDEFRWGKLTSIHMYIAL